MKGSARREPLQQEESLLLRIVSFSYRTAPAWAAEPHGGGFVFDCRCLPNPGLEPALAPLTGTDEDVRLQLEGRAEVEAFYASCLALVDTSARLYLARGYSMLSVGFGCTGGRHRSVYLADRLRCDLSARYRDDRVAIDLHHLNLESARGDHAMQTFRASRANVDFSRSAIMTSQDPSSEAPSSLSRSSESIRGTRPTAKVLCNGLRQVNLDDSDWPIAEVEREAHRALALPDDAPFHVLERLRLFDGKPRVLQAAYINPAVVPSDTLTGKDFAVASLADFYDELGLERLSSRPRRMLSRLANKRDLNKFREPTDYRQDIAGAILDVRQMTYAREKASGRVVPLEYLYSLYLEWPYYVPGLRPDRQWFELAGDGRGSP